MKLNFRKLGSGHPLFVLHGVFGSADNWQTVGKELADDFTVYLIDQRNHGNSPHDDAMNYEVMTDDLQELIRDEGLDSIYLMGHSMGGKAAMHFATIHPDLIDKLIVVDIAPKYYSPHHQQIFKGFRSVDLANVKSRKEADDGMAKIIPEFGVRQFILKNLTRGNNGFAWKINLAAIEKNIEIIGEGLPDNAVFEKATLFIGGTKSKYIQEEDERIIKRHFPSSTIEMIDGAGHWVHAEKPRELLEKVVRFLN